MHTQLEERLHEIQAEEAGSVAGDGPEYFGRAAEGVAQPVRRGIQTPKVDHKPKLAVGLGDKEPVRAPGCPVILGEAEKLNLPAKEREIDCLLYTSPSPRDKRQSRMPSSA